MVVAGEPDGAVQYKDHGPWKLFKLRSSDITAVLVSADQHGATILGTGKIDRRVAVDFRIDVKDLPGEPDTFQIRLSNGYDSGEQQIRKGDIDVDCEDDDDDPHSAGGAKR